VQQECKHAELISYKVHKDQFKLLHVGNKDQAKTSKTQQARLETSCDSSTDEEGESQCSSSPLDKQLYDQSSELKHALANSNALAGDYVELKNCKRCGCMIFKDLTAAIKPKSEDFNADISPSQLLTKMFSDEARYKIDHFLPQTALKDFPVARIYDNQRNKLVCRIFEMGKQFNQRLKTIHIAVELLERFFLDRKSQQMREIQQMTSKIVTIILTTCFLIASKYDEIDD
jgi:hypothetical protein